MHKRFTLLWLLLGLGSRLQVVASLSITEIIVLVMAPYVFARDYPLLKRHGIGPLLGLSLLVIAGCVIASIVNNSPPGAIWRGLAATGILSCSIVFAHWILCRDPAGFRWYILMLPMSVFVSTFIFQSAVELAMFGDSIDEIMRGPIFWISRLKPLVMAPTQGWYLQMPGFINIVAPLFMAVFAILTTTSGRSAMLGAVGFVVLVIVGGKTQRTMSRITRHFGALCMGGFLLVGVMYGAYKVSASQGWLGEDALKKYEKQTSGGQGGIGRLILGGRGDSVIGILACLDKPIVGWGPWALDENGYVDEFISKYGTLEDMQALAERNAQMVRVGLPVRMIPVHSHLTMFWAWYGIFGLIFILYISFVLVRYLKQDVAVVPQWFAWLACSVPGMFWAICFSPLTDRFGTPLFVVACLMARAIRKGTFHLPVEMIAEIEKTKGR